MEIVKLEKKLCPCCMEEHDVQTVRVDEENEFKGIRVEYPAIYEYCDQADEYLETEDMMSENDIAMKDAYRMAVGLLTTDQISAIRARYGISQTGLATLLGWGAKTITRYESHQVQDPAHNTILVKLAEDPEWFIDLLKAKKTVLAEESFRKYMATATALFEQAQDMYLRKSIYAQYAPFENNLECCGSTKLSLDKFIDIVNYYANSAAVTGLYLVKLLKSIWYADALAYKRTGASMTGLVYKALPMGAVPVAYKLLIDLKGIEYEEVDFGDNIANHFIPTAHTEYPTLTEEDKRVLDTIIAQFGAESKVHIVKRMHDERAYTETAMNDVIQYKYALDLSLC